MWDYCCQVFNISSFILSNWNYFISFVPKNSLVVEKMLDSVQTVKLINFRNKRRIKNNAVIRDNNRTKENK